MTHAVTLLCDHLAEVTDDDATDIQMVWDFAPGAEPPMTKCPTCLTFEPILRIIPKETT